MLFYSDGMALDYMIKHKIGGLQKPGKNCEIRINLTHVTLYYSTGSAVELLKFI